MPKHTRIKAVITLLMVLIGSSLFTPPVSAATNGYAGYEFSPNPYYLQSDTKALLTVYSDNSGLPLTSIVWQDPQGNTISCGAVCRTTYQYSPNGLVVSSTSEFFIQQRPSGTYTALVTYSQGVKYRANFYIAPDPQAPIVAMAPVGGFAQGVGVNPTTNRIYVAKSGYKFSLFENHYVATPYSNVSVMDGISNTVIATVDVGSAPLGVGVNPTTNRIYVTNRDSDNVSVIDGISSTVVFTVTMPVGSYPMGVGVNPTTNRVYVANESLDNVAVIDGASNTVLTTVTVGIGPRAIGVNPTTNRIYVANEYTHNVSVIDGASNTVLTTLPVGTFPLSVGVNPATNRIYVGSSDNNSSLTVIDGASNTVLATLPMENSNWGFGVNPTTNHIYLANGGYSVSVLDGASNKVIATIPLGRPAMNIDINPITNRVYVANGGGLTISVIEDNRTATETKFYLPLTLRTNP